MLRFSERIVILAIDKNLKFSISVKYCINIISLAKSIADKNKDDRLTDCIP